MADSVECFERFLARRVLVDAMEKGVELEVLEGWVSG